MLWYANGLKLIDLYYSPNGWWSWDVFLLFFNIFSMYDMIMCIWMICWCLYDMIWWCLWWCYDDAHDMIWWCYAMILLCLCNGCMVYEMLRTTNLYYAMMKWNACEMINLSYMICHDMHYADGLWLQDGCISDTLD